jgi:7,8-dihydropterin-6-yl-methyl-4-(beta-D-ribofuranosyl)aminobenzene 5'-phosphate synthase
VDDAISQRLRPVDRVVVTVLVDNTYDALLADQGSASRPHHRGLATIPAPQYLHATTSPGLRAEHGFAALVTVSEGDTSATLLLDTGITPDGLLSNADLMRLDLSRIEALVLSHGHYDHTGGLLGLAERVGPLPLVLHPTAWSRRRIAVPGQEPEELPTLHPEAVTAAGYEVVERREPTLLLGERVLVTGEIERVTGYERGMPYHQARQDGTWVEDPTLPDDQAIVVHVRGRGLLVLTGCGHSGVVNTIGHAQRLTGVDRLHALIGGLHLSGRAMEPAIAPTIEALIALNPALVAPAHCTGWVAQHRIAAALPSAYVPSASGTSYAVSAQ